MADSKALARNGRRNLGEQNDDRIERLSAEEQIRTTREEIARTTSQIQKKLRTDLDWKVWVARYPLPTVTIALAAGVLTGLSLPSSSARRSSPSASGKRKLRASEEEAIQETGKTTVLATVAANVATTLLRQGGNYLIQRLFDEKR